MVEHRGIINPVSDRLRAFVKGQRSSMTRAEDLFWRQVRAGRLGGFRFKRQVPLSPYVVDFLCVSARLVIELDGVVHENDVRRARDLARDAWLGEEGFRVIRFTNDEALGNCDRVLSQVIAALGPSPASLREAPSPAKWERVSGGEVGPELGP